MKLPTEIQKARILAAKHYPYLGAALWRVSFHEVSNLMGGIGPMASDEQWRVYYDSEWFKKLTLQQLAFCLVHEINHCLRIHGKRCKERDKRLWNIAADLEINDDIATEFNVVSEDFNPCFPKGFKLGSGLMAEAYYDLLINNKSPNLKVVKVNCGSGAHGHGEEHEVEGGGADAFEGEAVSEAEGDLIRHQVAKAAKAAGNVPAGLQRFINETLEPKVSWQKLLSKFMKNAGHATAGCVDYSYSRPSRRAWPGIILPKMIAHRARVGIVVDTSGSMGPDLLASALAEVKGIARTGSMDANVYFVDTEVAGTGRAGDRNLGQKARGGGGTDMGRGIDAALETRKRPDIIVVLTDGYTPWPQASPPVPVIVCLLGEADYYHPPGWANVVKVQN